MISVKLFLEGVKAQWDRSCESILLGDYKASEVASLSGDWRKLQNDRLYSFCSLPKIIWVIKSKNVRWTGHVARMGEKIHAYSILVVKYKERYLFGVLGIDGGMQCNWVWKKKTRKKNWNVWTRFIRIRIGTRGRMLWKLKWTFRFHKMWGNFSRMTLLYGVSCLVNIYCWVLRYRGDRQHNLNTMWGGHIYPSARKRQSISHTGSQNGRGRQTAMSQ